MTDLSASLRIGRWVVTVAVAGTVIIGLGAFWLSFATLSHLALLAGIPQERAWVWPVIVDGVIVVATVSVVALEPYGRDATRYPWMLLVVGAAVSVTANAFDAFVEASPAIAPGVAAAVSAVPPLILLAITHLTVLLTARMRRPALVVSARPEHSESEEMASTKTRDPSRPESLHSATTARRPRGRAEGLRQEAILLSKGHVSQRAIGRQLGVHASTVGRWLKSDVERPRSERDDAVSTSFPLS